MTASPRGSSSPARCRPASPALDIPAVLGGAGGPAIPGILRAVEPFSSYPTRLLTLLTPAYLTQFIAVTNQGISRERAAQGAARLPLSIQAFLPEVLLLLEGFNDINLELGLQPAGTRSTSTQSRTLCATWC